MTFSTLPLSNLTLRILSASVLAPLFIGAFWLGYPWLQGVLTLAAAGLYHEWFSLAQPRSVSRRWPVLFCTALTAGVLLALPRSQYPLLMVLFFIALGAVNLWWLPRHKGLALLALPYLGLPLVALGWLAAQAFSWIVWALLIVWLTDIGAYFAGRALGGPKLAPRVSPKKTWSGAIGGLLCALGGAALLGHWLHAPLWPLLLWTGLLSILGQMGDLTESALKRHFGVKDSGQIIPGHGGVLDRLDSLLFVALALLALSLTGHHPLFP